VIATSTDISILAAQLCSWCLLLLLGDVNQVLRSIPLITIMGVGVGLAIISAHTLGIKSYFSLSRPRSTNVLVRSGIYRYVRHPLYSGVMVAGLALLLSRPTLVVGLAFLMMVLVTNARAGMEERMLEQQYPEYAVYKKGTKRFIPFLY
jgi:protein-S-isoprenylcysteine O-methyltransferase Ste14